MENTPKHISKHTVAQKQNKLRHVSCGRAVQLSGRIMTRVYQLARGLLAEPKLK
jgi:hypothetical protein